MPTTDPAQECAYPANFLEFVEQIELAHGSAPALCFDGSTVTYAELRSASTNVSQMLHSAGVEKGDVVGVLANRSIELPILLLGIARAGGAYLPLDPEYPPTRLAQMLEDARPSVIFVQPDLLDQLPDADADIIVTEPDQILSTSATCFLEPPQVSGRDPAYVIFTSGSTGRPKGVINSHAGLLNRLEWMQKLFQLDRKDSVLQKTPYGFDVSVWEFFWPVMTGARLVVAQPGGHRDPAYLARLIHDESITLLHFVPSMLAVFLDQPNLRELCASLRVVVVSGEALSPGLQNKFFEALPHCELHNLYGPTEAAIDVTHWRCSPDAAAKTIPIGYPVDNTTIHILDPEGRPVADGEVGEIYIGGVQVALGYVNRPDLTAERFIENPFPNSPGTHLYRTGDLGRVRSDGAIEFLGRIDHQIKLRGNRIELGEIEAQLEALDFIKRAVVVATGEPEPDLAAYYETQGDSRLDTAGIREALEKNLPDYMIPRYFTTVEQFPVTPNGKLDRKALPAPARVTHTAGPPPRDELEKHIAHHWQDILGLDSVPRDVPFFELGGSSLAAARFVNRMQESLGEFIYIVSIFDAPTVENYAKFLKKEYAGAVARQFPSMRIDAAQGQASRFIDAAAIARFERCVPQLTTTQDAGSGTARNDPAVFILAPPRSGTTLLRVMLAGHPSLFAAAELQLLCFRTMGERARAFTDKYSLWLEGTVRAVMELKGCDADTAKAILSDMESRDVPTQACMRELQTWAKPRMLLDKSPSYALDPAVLAKAEADFENPLYIHLVRHPLSMIDSFVSYHMNQVLYINEHDFQPSELAELVWTVSHRNILRFLETIPAERQHRILFESMVTAPKSEMKALCDGFGLPFVSQMINPYEGIQSKMTDGIYPDSTPMGDTRLLERKAIDPSVADRWRKVKLDRALGPLTAEIAERFGYEGLPADNLAVRRSRARGRQRLRRRSH